MAERSGVNRAGYLRESYHYFHLRDSAGQELDYHFHEFDKLVILISGRVDYLVEDRSYPLEPWTVLLVRHHTIHKAVIDRTEPYERIILYLDRRYFERVMPGAGLLECFDEADRRGRHLLHLLFQGGDPGRLPLQLRAEGFGGGLVKEAAIALTVPIQGVEAQGGLGGNAVKLLGHEFPDLLLPLHQQTEGGGLHPPGGEALADLGPEQGADLVAHQPVGFNCRRIEFDLCLYVLGDCNKRRSELGPEHLLCFLYAVDI